MLTSCDKKTNTYSIEIKNDESDIPSKVVIDDLLWTKAKGKISVIYPLNTNFCRFSSSVAWEYLNASIVADKLCEFADKFSYKILKFHEGNKIKINFKASSKNFTESLLDVIELYYENNPEGFPEAYAQIEDDLNRNKISSAIPDLLDGYFANLVAGGFVDYEDEDIEFFLSLHPEWDYRFWRSAISNNFNTELFVSEYCWIVPKLFNINKGICPVLAFVLWH